MGRRDRAWHCRGSQRQDDHAEWLENLLDNHGYTMNAIVEIMAAGLFQQEALVIERELISEHKPRFNRPMGLPKILSEKDIEYAQELRDTGQYYHQVAEAVGVSTMTVWRALNG